MTVYWATGGYLLAWFTPYALQSILISIILGLVLLAWFGILEDRGIKTPLLLGCALWSPPMTMALIGATWLFLQLLGLV